MAETLAEMHARMEGYKAKHSAGLYRLNGIYVWAFDNVFVSPNHEDYVIVYRQCPRDDVSTRPREEMPCAEWFEKAYPLYLPSESLSG